MPQYRFVLGADEAGSPQAEEFGIFNDAGALQFARRYSHSRPVEVWERERLVGRIEPSHSPAEAG